ncbi:MAG: carboxylating nicotinate-nucleotide diphosphorylase [Deltaproteobacteria bacterium]|nr:carboxylating nicotinate-nucleotide diphosphorylase [Deltaproteobacteria bacterium]
MNYFLTPAVDELIRLAIEEDLGRGDITSYAVLDGDGGVVKGVLLAKQDLVMFGLQVARRVFERVDPKIEMSPRVPEGARVARGTVLADLAGPAISLLAAERTALNFLQRLSGVATQSRRFADAVAGTKARVVDTRKTTPGWRALEKAAVAAGGCGNHRADLGSGLLIKDNHIAACGGVRLAVERARARAPHPLRVEVEVTSLEELDEALDAGADVVLLDNMPLPSIEEAVRVAREKNVLVEVSGGVTLETVAQIARTGADLISAGALTHSAPSVDISLEVEAK